MSDKSVLKLKTSELQIMASMLDAGLSFSEIFLYLKESRSRRDSEMIDSLLASIYKGEALSDIFNQTSIGEDSLYSYMINSAISNGNLPEVLKRVVDHMEDKQKRIGQVLTVITYPTIIASATTLLICGLLIFIIPNLRPIISLNKQGIPLVTHILMFASDMFIEHWLTCIVLLITIIFAFLIAMHKKSVRVITEKMLIKIPIIGYMLEIYFCSSYSLSLVYFFKASADISQAFEKTAQMSGSMVFKEELQKIAVLTQSGLNLSKSLQYTQYLPKIWRLYSQVAEQTSSYAEVFERLYDHYCIVFEKIIGTMAKLTEPILMLMIGLVIGAIAYGILSPIYGLMNNLG